MGREWQRKSELEGDLCGAFDAESSKICGAQSSWVAEFQCGCGAIHSKVYRCHAHRIEELEAELETEKRASTALIKLARRGNKDIRTDAECRLTALGFSKHPRDEGDALWHELNDVAMNRSAN